MILLKHVSQCATFSLFKVLESVLCCARHVVRLLCVVSAAIRPAQMVQETNGVGPHTGAPSHATDAVLKPSDPVPDGAQEVKGIEFDKFREQDITVSELVAGMATMGFQASAVSKAVQIVNDMVGDNSGTLLL